MPRELRSRHYGHHFRGALAELDVDDQQNYSEDEAHSSDHDVGEPEEWILGAQQRGGGQNHLLGALEHGHRIAWK